ncbi:Cyn operon transcriptional activator [Tatumella ptyseos]|uniref:Cyn operon transcriptional activator n=1 Tax=Tatumella ptyseos TaxID=82987 RepID=A0A2X5SNY2_9GAMM|nr:Cyn operon transcriptional activator [Tatumella ptyseos]
MNARILSETAVLYFMQVVNCGSISEAATRMHVVPSAVSRQIRRLENALETALFERQARGVTLTPAGELLAAYARRTLLDAVQVTNEIQSLRQVSESKIKIACTHGFASHFMPAGSPVSGSAGRTVHFSYRSPRHVKSPAGYVKEKQISASVSAWEPPGTSKSSTVSRHRCLRWSPPFTH